jgi:uncharacterized protein Yka (UPF0111/DUF47 family)
MDDLEHEGDAITHQTFEQLHCSVITPFDREDIALLAHSLDDVSDFVHEAADAMLLYKVANPTNRAKQLVDIKIPLGSLCELNDLCSLFRADKT